MRQTKSALSLSSRVRAPSCKLFDSQSSSALHFDLISKYPGGRSTLDCRQDCALEPTEPISSQRIRLSNSERVLRFEDGPDYYPVWRSYRHRLDGSLCCPSPMSHIVPVCLGTLLAPRKCNVRLDPPSLTTTSYRLATFFHSELLRVSSVSSCTLRGHSGSRAAPTDAQSPSASCSPRTYGLA